MQQRIGDRSRKKCDIFAIQQTRIMLGGSTRTLSQKKKKKKKKTVRGAKEHSHDQSCSSFMRSWFWRRGDGRDKGLPVQQFLAWVLFLIVAVEKRRVAEGLRTVRYSIHQTQLLDKLAIVELAGDV